MNSLCLCQPAVSALFEAMAWLDSESSSVQRGHLQRAAISGKTSQADLGKRCILMLAGVNCMLLHDRLQQTLSGFEFSKMGVTSYSVTVAGSAESDIVEMTSTKGTPSTAACTEHGFLREFEK